MRHPESSALPPLAMAEADFIRRYPANATTTTIDALRASEYGRLAAEGETYLDYTGASVHALSQVNMHVDLLSRLIAGNPHSANVPSRKPLQSGCPRSCARLPPNPVGPGLERQRKQDI